MSETGIATIGASTERHEPRNKKMTSITMQSVSINVLKTSCMASLI